ncbi:MAG: two-component system sensor histidine kinase [Phycisphaerales bacterium]|nr:two-component system sensor histidine kinase [Phycisphaerales bacterium]
MNAPSTILAPLSAADVPASGAGSDYARRIDELGRIILAYSDITERLQQSHEQLTRTVQTLRKELSDKNRQLERKNRLAALGEMAAGMAHEIRNPLGGIQLYASLLARDVADRPDSLELVRKISGGVKRLEGLVGQVLQFTREINVHAGAMDLAEAVAQAVEYAGPAIQARGVRCMIDGPDAMPISADPLLLGQAVLNLLLNAVEAAEQGNLARQVTVRFGLPPIESDAKQFHLAVTDSGPGIAPEILDRIFNPFFTTKETGTGLGLAIVHRVVEAHDGTILAMNEPGGGARFEIRI